MALASCTDKDRCILRLEVGHESWMLSSPTPSCSHPLTHRWKVYVRGINDFVLDESLIEKVVFQLHEDFESARRVVTSPPYEVSETGYAGFSIPIYLSFVNYKREFCLEYDMNLRYVSQDKTKVIKTLEFRDPKPDLRAKLINAGAEVIIARPKPSLPTSTSFQELFGETLHVVPTEKMKCSKNHLPRKEKCSTSANSVRTGDAYKESSILKEKKSSLSSGKSSHSGAGSKTKSSKTREDSHSSHSHGDKKKTQFTHYLHSNPKLVSPSPTTNHQSSDGVVAECSKASTSNSSSKTNSSVGSSSSNRSCLQESFSNCSKAAERNASKDCSKVVNHNRTQEEIGADKNKLKVNKSKRKPKEVVSGDSPVHVRQKRRSDSGLESDLSSAANVQDCSPFPCSANCVFSPCSTHSQDRNSHVSPTASDSSHGSSSCNGTENDSSIRFPCTNNITPSPKRIKSCDDSQKYRNVELLTDLQHKIMTETDRSVVQQIADLISHQSGFEIHEPFLEFDLCCLNGEVIEQLLLCFEKS
ncbi:unnamed protein product [Soboliphyme baturini]|uniref:AHD domain-containing protein n=1 Tax=Soboliphyme baturini TaxID=241478 RepID=A0A183IRX4_9BILA|nr:unnamed protein product [Soboliphyme baturini]